MLLSIKSANMLINVHSNVQTHPVLRKIKFIIIGTNIASIRENALEKEHDLALLISTARTIEATEEATKLIDSESPSSSFNVNCVENEGPQHAQVNKIGKRGGKYSQKAQRRENF